jgi:hypothetical protein
MSEPVVVYEPKAAEVLPAPHSLEENERVIERGLESFVEVGRALCEIKESGQYIEAGYDTFEAYCRDRWDMERNTAYVQIEAARVVGVLDRDRDHGLPTSQKAVRPLIPVLNSDGPDAVRNAWTQIVERHKGDGPITGREVQTFLNPALGTSPSQRETSDIYLSALDKLRKGMDSVRWAMESRRNNKTPDQVRERYALYAESVRALAETMEALAKGEKFGLGLLHERLDVGVWDR